MPSRATFAAIRESSTSTTPPAVAYTPPPRDSSPSRLTTFMRAEQLRTVLFLSTSLPSTRIADDSVEPAMTTESNVSSPPRSTRTWRSPSCSTTPFPSSVTRWPARTTTSLTSRMGPSPAAISTTDGATETPTVATCGPKKRCSQHAAVAAGVPMPTDSLPSDVTGTVRRATEHAPSWVCTSNFGAWVAPPPPDPSSERASPVLMSIHSSPRHASHSARSVDRVMTQRRACSSASHGASRYPVSSPM